MLEKIYKMSIIIIAIFIVAISLYLVLKPTDVVSQNQPNINYAIPESHVWEAYVNNGSANDAYLLFNKKTGEYKFVRFDVNSKYGGRSIEWSNK
jgi:hypothetical protein